MKRSIFIIFALLIAHLWCYAQFNSQNLRLTHDEANQNRFANLELYAVRANHAFAKMHEHMGRYLTLKEALEKKKIVITEVSNGQVNSLFLQNISNDTIMVLAGEVVKGGKQDRMVGEDVLLHPRSKKHEVKVFCVEHGRWRADKGDMNFNQYYTISSNEVRKAGTVQKNQNEVWKKVAETTTRNQAGSRTGTLANLQSSESFITELKRYTDFFGNLYEQDNDVIGIIAVSGDKILGADFFASHSLFITHFPNLLNSYATEAITTGKPVTIKASQVQAYFADLMDEEHKQEEKIERNGVLLKAGDKKLHISTF